VNERLRLPDADASLEVGDRIVAIADFGVLREVEQIIVGEDGGARAAGGA
jgi:trk system potassium uptake protein TrkA